MSRKCTGLKPTPVHAGRFETMDISTFRLGVKRRAGRRAPHFSSGLDWLERAHALRCLYCRARPFRYVLPGVSLVVGTRGASTGGAGAGSAVVVTLHCDAVAFVHGGLRRLRRCECRGSDHGEGGGEGAGDCGVCEEVLRIHEVILSREHRRCGSTAFIIGVSENPTTARLSNTT